MTRNNILFSVILCFSFILSISAQQDSVIIPCQNIEIKCTQSPGGNHIINNEAEYKDLLSERSPHSACAGYELPPIDFTQYTLFGIVDGSAGCKTPKVDYNISKYPDDTYAFNLNVGQIGKCKILLHIDIWCLTQKIDTITFNINHYDAE